MRRWAFVISACLLCALLLGGCGDDGLGKGFRFPLAAEPQQLDPQVSTDISSVTVLSALFEGLTRLDEDGNAVPGAADWSVSADGLTYTFQLRESYWSTISVRGEETDWDEPTRVTADDFVFGMQRALSPDTGSEVAEALYGIVNAEDIHAGRKSAATLGVRALADDTLTVRLSAPDVSFPARLATTPFSPCNRAFFAYTAGRYGLEKNYLLTNGPFTLTAWNHGTSLLLNKNEHYHAAEEIAPAAVRFVIGTDDPVTALTEGTMDAAALTAAQLDDAAEAGVQVVSLRDSVRFLYFNTADAVLYCPAFRQALRDGLEWDALYDYIAAQGETPAGGFVAPDATVGGERYRTDGNNRRFTTAADKARQRLTEALATVYPESKKPVTPRLNVLAAEDEVSANLARYILQSWQKNLKINANLQLTDASTLQARLATGNYQIAIAVTTAGGLTGAENLSAFAGGNSRNVTGFADAGFDAALTRALRGGRSELGAAEERLRDACPALPLSFTERYYGIAAGDEGITVRPFDGGSYGSAFRFEQAKKRDK